MVSLWMEHGHILSYVTQYPGVNRLELVRPTPRRSKSELTRVHIADRGQSRSRLSTPKRSYPRRPQERTWILYSFFSSGGLPSFQPNILIDGGGIPRLSDFGLCSITKNINSVNASTPNHGCTVRYCAPELLDIDGVVRTGKKKRTQKSDVYSLSMVIVEVCLPSEMSSSH